MLILPKKRKVNWINHKNQLQIIKGYVTISSDVITIHKKPNLESEIITIFKNRIVSIEVTEEDING